MTTKTATTVFVLVAVVAAVVASWSPVGAQPTPSVATTVLNVTNDSGVTLAVSQIVDGLVRPLGEVPASLVAPLTLASVSGPTTQIVLQLVGLGTPQIVSVPSVSTITALITPLPAAPGTIVALIFSGPVATAASLIQSVILVVGSSSTLAQIVAAITALVASLV